MKTQKINPSNARLLAEKSGWNVTETTDNVDGWTMSFTKPAQAIIRVRFSANGMLTGLNGVDFTTGIIASPGKDKGTRLSHWLTEGII